MFACLAALTLTGCGDDETEAPKSSKQVIDENLRWERPASNPNNLFIPHYLSDGIMNYCLEFNFEANHSQWVAYRYDSSLKANNNGGKRTDAWNWDPALDKYKEHQITTSGFGKPYQRGHLLGSAERYYSNEANEQTFYMTNMSPMIGAFNETDWGKGIETYIRNWGRGMEGGDTLYVVKGGTWDQDTKTISVSNTKGQQIKLVVPHHYFAACLKRLSTGQLYAIGFWIEHKDHLLSGNDKKAKELAKASAVSIDQLERLTGLDFFHNVPDDIEEQVEKTCNTNEWGM